jgi:lipopolysaccharide export system protein LptA
MKFFLGLVLVVVSILAKEVDVDIQADKFEANKAKNLILFTGNVSMLKGEDTLLCRELTVITKLSADTNKTVVKKYIAVGDVNLTLKRPDTLMIGSGDKITYDVDKQVYFIEGNGYLEDVNGSKIIKGEKIYVDEISGNTKIDGKKDKPVQFKLKIESNK